MELKDLTEEFNQIIPQLKSYLLRMTASIQDAEDIVHDTYLKACDKLNSFRGDSSLKTWIFTIASNLAKDNLRARKRWTENVTDICKAKALENPSYFPEVMHIQSTSTQGQFEIKEHITFCFTCIAKSLPLEQQVCLLLKEVYDFKNKEISIIMDLSEAMVKYYLHTSRSKMVDIFEGRCALINKEGVCHQCSELNGIFNPKQNFNEELQKVEFAKQGNNENREYLLDLRLQIVRGIDPFQSMGADLQLHHLEHNRKIMEEI